MARMHPELKEEQILWRLVINKICTWHELETSYTLKDVMKANAMLDIQNEIDSIMSQED